MQSKHETESFRIEGVHIRQIMEESIRKKKHTKSWDMLSQKLGNSKTKLL